MSIESILISGIVALASAVAALFALFVAVGKWAKSNVVEPLVHNHLKLIKTLEDSIPRNTKALDNIAASNRIIQEHAEDEVVKLGEIQQSLDRQSDVIRTTAKELKDHREWAAGEVKKLGDSGEGRLIPRPSQ